MADAVSIAIHLEITDGDVEKAKTAAADLAKELGARHATVSTTAGVWDVLKPAVSEAETVDGEKIQVKNPEAFVAFPQKFERVADDPTPEQIRELRGEEA
jgi:hypothetical protein